MTRTRPLCSPRSPFIPPARVAQGLRHQPAEWPSRPGGRVRQLDGAVVPRPGRSDSSGGRRALDQGAGHRHAQPRAPRAPAEGWPLQALQRLRVHPFAAIDDLDLWRPAGDPARASMVTVCPDARPGLRSSSGRTAPAAACGRSARSSRSGCPATSSDTPASAARDLQQQLQLDRPLVGPGGLDLQLAEPPRQRDETIDDRLQAIGLGARPPPDERRCGQSSEQPRARCADRHLIEASGFFISCARCAAAPSSSRVAVLAQRAELLAPDPSSSATALVDRGHVAPEARDAGGGHDHEPPRRGEVLRRDGWPSRGASGGNNAATVRPRQPTTPSSSAPRRRTAPLPAVSKMTSAGESIPNPSGKGGCKAARVDQPRAQQKTRGRASGPCGAPSIGGPGQRHASRRRHPEPA